MKRNKYVRLTFEGCKIKNQFQWFANVPTKHSMSVKCRTEKKKKHLT